MISQSSWRRRHIAPVAKAEGLAMKGSVLRLAGDRGDCAVLEFVPRLIDRSMEVFFVRASRFACSFLIPYQGRTIAYSQDVREENRGVFDGDIRLRQGVTP